MDRVPRPVKPGEPDIALISEQREGVWPRMRLFGVLAVAAILLLSSCEKAPQEQIDAATHAYEASSKDPDVLTYAPDSLRIAQEKLSDLRAEIDVQSKKSGLMRRYEASKNLAEEARLAAENATRDAAKAKEQARVDATALLDEFADSIPAFESKLWAARRVRGIKLDPDIPTLASDARIAAADARKDLDAGAFAAAKAKASTIREKLSDGEDRIAEAVRLAKGR
jgi:hypothetical protein